MNPEDLVFCDTETTGLDPDPARHEIWEVAIGRYDPDGTVFNGLVDYTAAKTYGDWTIQTWQLEPLHLGRADPMALKINRFHERYRPQRLESRPQVLAAVDWLTRGRHIVGAVPSFDEERLRILLRANNLCPTWHYHVCDVETLVLGYLYAQGRGDRIDAWSSDKLSAAVGVNPEDFDRHTAAGDVAWCIAQWEAVTSSEPALSFEIGAA